MMVSKVTVAVRAWAFCSLTRRARLSVPPNLVADLDARKRSNAMTVSKKERRYSFSCICAYLLLKILAIVL